MAVRRLERTSTSILVVLVVVVVEQGGGGRGQIIGPGLLFSVLRITQSKEAVVES